MKTETWCTHHFQWPVFVSVWVDLYAWKREREMKVTYDLFVLLLLLLLLLLLWWEKWKLAGYLLIGIDVFIYIFLFFVGLSSILILDPLLFLLIYIHVYRHAQAQADQHKPDEYTFAFAGHLGLPFFCLSHFFSLSLFSSPAPFHPPSGPREREREREKKSRRRRRQMACSFGSHQPPSCFICFVFLYTAARSPAGIYFCFPCRSQKKENGRQLLVPAAALAVKQKAGSIYGRTGSTVDTVCRLNVKKLKVS